MVAQAADPGEESERPLHQSRRQDGCARGQARDRSGQQLLRPQGRRPSLQRKPRQAIREIYEDLARSASFDGLLFHDDLTLSDREDANPPALETYRSWGLPGSVGTIRRSDDHGGRWTIFKFNALDNSLARYDFTAVMAMPFMENAPDPGTGWSAATRIPCHVLMPHDHKGLAVISTLPASSGPGAKAASPLPGLRGVVKARTPSSSQHSVEAARQ